jgi:EAL domain-containing protein (putative c-di-GMP-specific phosphodiesterase class I)
MKIEQGGSVDWLTGLPDMARFLKLAQLGVNAIFERGERPAVLALDLIGLKAYNMKYGRDAGDRLLQAFAEILRKHFGGETCSRFAEDHFYAFAPSMMLRQRIDGLFEDFRYHPDMPTLPIRVGAYVLDPGDDVAAIAIDRAKIACDADRKTWHSHIVWFSDEMREEERLRIHVLERLDEAIDNKWIRPYYQAIVRSATCDLCGEEALARWQDPDFGMLTPNMFVPVLEEAGLLHRVDLHMVDCVLADFAKKRAAGVGIVPVSVNFSHRDLELIDIAEEVSSRADAANVPHELLRIEFTESAATANPHLLSLQISKLHEAGFEVWLDDFGSGFSSPNTLQEFDFDLIKLSMEVVGRASSKRERTVIISEVQMATRLGMGIIAEGVETEEMAVFLKNVGCNMLQGYFFSRPQSLVGVINHVERETAFDREDLREKDYWDSVSRVNLGELSSGDIRWDTDEYHGTEFPCGVLEVRDGRWRVLRANSSYREFLTEVGFIPRWESDLHAIPFRGEMDEEFLIAVSKCKASRGWVEIVSHLEYATGLHYHVRPVATTEHADAYVVASSPAVLGRGLGVYGDVPVSYAVFRVVTDEGNSKAEDVTIVFASDMYCEWVGKDRAAIVGKSYREMFPNASAKWLSYCKRAALKGETVRSVIYSPSIDRLLVMIMAPTGIEGCCSCSCIVVDEDDVASAAEERTSYRSS